MFGRVKKSKLLSKDLKGHVFTTPKLAGFRVVTGIFAHQLGVVDLGSMEAYAVLIEPSSVDWTEPPKPPIHVICHILSPNLRPSETH